MDNSKIFTPHLTIDTILGSMPNRNGQMYDLSEESRAKIQKTLDEYIESIKGKRFWELNTDRIKVDAVDCFITIYPTGSDITHSTLIGQKMRDSSESLEVKYKFDWTTPNMDMFQE